MRKYFLSNSIFTRKYWLKQIAVALTVAVPLNATTLINNGYNLPNNNIIYANNYMNNLSYHTNIPSQYVVLPPQNTYPNLLHTNLNYNIIINQHIYNIYQLPQTAITNNNKQFSPILNKKLQKQPVIKRMKTQELLPRKQGFKNVPKINIPKDDFKSTLLNNSSHNFEQLCKIVDKALADDASYSTVFIDTDKDKNAQTKKNKCDNAK